MPFCYGARGRERGTKHLAEKRQHAPLSVTSVSRECHNPFLDWARVSLLDLSNCILPMVASAISETGLMLFSS